ncbi:MAG TPA: extracellular solute-binding protein [Thermopolyspora sp.]
MRAAGLATAVCAVAAVSVACGSAPQETAGGASKAATATSAQDLGGLDALVAEAKKEGQLNTIALPPDWANYGELISAFTAKYGIKINNENPDGSSSDEITAVKTRKGQERAPDVVDISQAFALSGAQEGLFAPYKVQTWDKLPDTLKDPNGAWYNDYGGYISIGCDAKKIKTCPQTFADLLTPEYKGKVALNGNPTKSGSAFGGVFAAALAGGGSFDDIQPGLDFFKRLKDSGNYNPVETTTATVEKGETPISIDWDYLNAKYADEFNAKGLDWHVVVPTDGKYAAYYVQAINKDAPHPAAARLWQEFLFSPEGQNLYLKGYARPALLPAMTADKTVDATLVTKLPEVEGTPTFPTDAQIKKAQEAVANGWGAAVSG